MAENQFNPALPLPIKWSIGDDRFNEGQQVLSLTIPVDCVPHLTEHLMNLVDQKAKDGEVYDFNKKEKVKTKCVQIYSKAMDGQFGVFGNINPSTSIIFICYLSEPFLFCRTSRDIHYISCCLNDLLPISIRCKYI